MSLGEVRVIHRYPVKGLSPDEMEAVELAKGETLPHDRAWALENGRSGFEPSRPEYLKSGWRRLRPSSTRRRGR